MEEVSLSETETRYYSDLFLCCDVEKTGKIPMLKAMELYRSANVSNDVIREITSLSGIPSTALHISRAQFYSCLKLIAAYQAAVPLRQELVAATVQLPLPRFSWKDSPSGGVELHHAGVQSNGLHVLPPPVADRRNSLPRRPSEWSQEAGAAGSRRGSAVNSATAATLQQQHSDVQSTDSEVEQNESSGGGGCDGVGGAGTGSSSREARRRGSPEAWSTNSDSPTPTNSVAERPWAKETLWHGLLGDEHRQLLGTEEESSDRHSSDDDNETDLESIYQITAEQRDYYYKQFKAVQHDPHGLLSGHVARVFFEKSRIPVEELRHIWQLCDVTRDGALSLAEFTAAMHLVVLRRNNITLPAVLPACLHPSVLQLATLGTTTATAAAVVASTEPPEADLLHLHDDDEEDNTDNTIINASAVAKEKNVMNLSTLSTSSQASTNSRQTSALTPPPLPAAVAAKNRSISNSPIVDASITPPAATAKPQERQVWVGDAPPAIDKIQNAQWTKFTESPTSNVSSPGPKPVNFDMQRTAQAVVSDPQILHPVPLRVTPIAGTLASNEMLAADAAEPLRKTLDATRDTSPKQPPSGSGNNNNNNNSSISNSSMSQSLHHRDSLQNNDLRAIQRPQAKKLPVKNIGALPPPPQRESSIGGGGVGSIVGAGGDELSTSASTLNCANAAPQPALLFNKKEPPPLPPPRPHRHGRSSSLDLNKFKICAPGGQQSEIMAQTSFDLQTTTGFADFTQFPEGCAASIHDNINEQQQYSLPPQQAAAGGAAPPPPPPIPAGGGAGGAAANALPPTRFLLQTSQQRVSAFEVYRKPSTPRNSQSPTTTTAAAAVAVAADNLAAQQHQPQLTSIPTHPPPTAPAPVAHAATNNISCTNNISSSSTAATMATPSSSCSTTHLPNADVYEKRVNAISETLKHVSFKSDNNMSDILRHLREQNSLLLRLCNDLSDELLSVQTRKEEMRLKLEAAVAAAASSSSVMTMSATGGACDVALTRTGSASSMPLAMAPVTANITGGSGGSMHSNV